MHVLFKNVIRKMNKYIEDKNERKYKKINILKNIIWRNVQKTLKTIEKLLKKLVYWITNWLFQLVKKLKVN